MAIMEAGDAYVVDVISCSDASPPTAGTSISSLFDFYVD